MVGPHFVNAVASLDLCAHLTNIASEGNEQGAEGQAALRRRRAISDMNELVGPRWGSQIWPSVRRAVAPSVVSFGHKLRCEKGLAGPDEDGCFQLFGIDAVLNASGHAFVMEVNTDPGLNPLLAELEHEGGQAQSKESAAKLRMYRGARGCAWVRVLSSLSIPFNIPTVRTTFTTKPAF